MIENHRVSEVLTRLALIAGLCVSVFCFSVHADDPAPGGAASPTGPAIQAVFTTKARYAVYDPGEPVSLQVTVTGPRALPDVLHWEVNDYQDTVMDSGDLPVPAGDSEFPATLALKHYGAGYFEVHLTLKISGATLPAAGSRPAGYVSYGVLPDIPKLPLKWRDDSRFGAQGTTFLQSGQTMAGSPFQPLYGALGLGWVYDGYKMGECESEGPGSFQPIVDPEQWKKRAPYDFTAAGGLASILDLHGLPEWLIAYPPGASRPAYSLTEAGQAYPPNDWAEYESYIRDVALNQAARRQALFPNLKNDYYQIHWEPDWHWKGTDADFIKMYEVAHRAIHEGDPEGVLLGPNYGVLATGNQDLARLLPEGLANSLDGIATHLYYIPFGLPEERGLPGQVRELVSLTRRYLPAGAKIINTEWGTLYHGLPPQKLHGALRGEMAEFMRGHLIALGEGIDCTWYFYIADISSTGGDGLMYNLSTPHPEYGAIATSPKPMAMSAAVAVRILDGTKSMGPVDFLDPNICAYLFDRAGQHVLVLWSKDGQSREVTVPAGVAGLTRFDVMGNATALTSQDGLVRVQVDDLPSYLMGLTPNLYSSNTLAGEPIPMPTANGGENLGLAPSLQGGALVAFHDGQTLRLVAHAGSVELPRNLAPGQWLLARTQGTLSGPVGAELIQIGPPVQVTLTATTGIKAQLTMANQLREPVKGELWLISGDHRQDLGPVALGVGALLTREVPLDAVAGPGNCEPVTAQFRDSFGVLSASPPLHLEFTNADWVATAPRTDGLLNDWRLEQFTTFDSLADIRTGAASWAGPEDLSFRIGFEFDANCLYVGIKVRDQSHVQEKWANDCWMQDSVQLGIAAVPENGSWKYAQKLDLALRSTDGTILVNREPYNSGLTGGEIPAAYFQTHIVRVGDETRYFCAIPWNEIEPGHAGVPEAGKIGVGVFVNDVDRTAAGLSERKVMEGFGDGMGFFLPQYFGVVNLGQATG